MTGNLPSIIRLFPTVRRSLSSWSPNTVSLTLGAPIFPSLRKESIYQTDMNAMEPMVSFNANEIRNKKVDVLRAIRPISKDQVRGMAVRGQYGTGSINGKRVSAYESEPDVMKASSIETFAAIKLFVDNWRWQDVPFYLRTGKRLKTKVSEVVIQFRPVPHQSFPDAAALIWESNHLILQIHPQEGIRLGFQAKQPGSTLQLSPVDMHFSYQEAFKTRSPEAHETLLLDVMDGDATLFMRADQVEGSWSTLMPVLNEWDNSRPAGFPNYQSGTWGPKAAEALMGTDGRSWLQPTLRKDRGKKSISEHNRIQRREG